MSHNHSQNYGQYPPHPNNTYPANNYGQQQQYPQQGYFPNNQPYGHQQAYYPGQPSYAGQYPYMNSHNGNVSYPSQQQAFSPVPAVNSQLNYGGTEHNTTNEIQWMPTEPENAKISAWFTECDTEGKGVVGGLQIAHFLKRSNLSRETLRSIWAMVDSKRSGYINRIQFTTIIRLVSIACSPIYFGSPPDMDRFVKTLRDTIPLPAALDQPLTQSNPASGNNSGANSPKRVDSGNFSAYPSDQLQQQYPDPSVGGAIGSRSYPSEAVPWHPSPKDALATNGSTTADDFDDEDFEFTEFTASAPVQVSVQQETRVESTLGGEEDLMGFADAPGERESFGPMNDHLSTKSQSFLPDTAIEGVDIVGAEDEFEEMGEFTSAKETAPLSLDSVVTAQQVVSVDISVVEEDKDKSLIQPESIPPPAMGLSSTEGREMMSAASAHRLSVFDEMVELDLQALHEDWEDFADSTNNDAAPEPMEAAKPVDLFEAAPSEPRTGAAVDPFSSGIQETQLEDDDFGDFGDFSNANPVNNSIVSTVPVENKASAVAPTPTPAVVDEFGEEEGELDFGDFETHTPPNSEKIIPAPSVIEDPKPLSTEPLVPTVSHDLIDLLSDDVMVGTTATNHPPSRPQLPTGQSDFLLDLLDFEVVEPVAHSVPPPLAKIENRITKHVSKPEAVELKSDSTPTAVQDPDDDDFDDFEGFVSADAPSASTSEPVKRKPLSIGELEVLSLLLSERLLYEEAYNCCQHILVLKKLSDLLEQKKVAMEKDNLDLASSYQRETAFLALSLESQEQEAAWEAAVAPHSTVAKGASLEDSAELIGLLQPNLAGQFKEKYLVKAPSPNAPIDRRMRHCVMGRRAARMIVATASTHKEYPTRWRRLMSVIMEKVKAGEKCLLVYKALSLPETQHQLLRREGKLQDYLKAISSVAEAGLWVCASCIEAMVFEKEAELLFDICSRHLKELRKVWAHESKFADSTIEDLILQAASLAERPHVNYCNFTLRPVSAQVVDDHSFKDDKSEIRRLFPLLTKVHERTFLQPVVNLWVQECQEPFPKCDADFS